MRTVQLSLCSWRRETFSLCSYIESKRQDESCLYPCRHSRRGSSVGEKSSPDQSVVQRDRRPVREDYSAKGSSKPGRRQKQRAPEPVSCDMVSIILRHYFPEWNQWLDELPDPRRREFCTYSIRHLVMLGLTLFLFQSGSRRQLRGDRQASVFLPNLLELTRTNEETVADPDTMNYLLERMDPTGLEQVITKATRTLIRSKSLDPFRFDGSVTIGFDGTELFRTNQPHCEKCLKAKHSDTSTSYFHSVLEAKLLTDNGMAVSLASEFIENSEDGYYKKQDCELKAFYRLAPKLKKMFPRMRILLLLDGLYANQQVLSICENFHWEYIIVFKEGSLPNLYKEAVRQCGRFPQKTLQTNSQSFAWAHNLEYEGHTVHAIFAKDLKDPDNGKFEFITDLRPHSKNIEKLINKGGRRRWKIENEGFNTQKTGGYELEHGYGRNSYAWKNYYSLLQLAHLLNQLMTKSDLFGKLQLQFLLKNGTKATGALIKFVVASAVTFYASIKNFIKHLGESFRHQPFTELGRSMDYPRSIQIRFAPYDTS